LYYQTNQYKNILNNLLFSSPYYIACYNFCFNLRRWRFKFNFW